MNTRLSKVIWPIVHAIRWVFDCAKAPGNYIAALLIGWSGFDTGYRLMHGQWLAAIVSAICLVMVSFSLWLDAPTTKWTKFK